MSKKLFVGGIAYRTTQEALRDHFAQAGEVESAVIVMERETGRSKGFGFVEMATEEEAQAAVQQLNGQELDGRSLTVNEARPQEDRPRTSGPRTGGGFRGGENRDRGERNSW